MDHQPRELDNRKGSGRTFSELNQKVQQARGQAVPFHCEPKTVIYVGFGSLAQRYGLTPCSATILRAN